MILTGKEAAWAALTGAVIAIAGIGGLTTMILYGLSYLPLMLVSMGLYVFASLRREVDRKKALDFADALRRSNEEPTYEECFPDGRPMTLTVERMKLMVATTMKFGAIKPTKPLNAGVSAAKRGFV